MKARFLAFVIAKPYAALALLCLLLWTPGVFSLPATDRDESRFAQSSKQMLETGNFIDIRFGLTPRYKKPAGIYWMQAATTAVAGLGDKGHIWTYRLPSLFGAIAAVWLLFWTARAFAPVETSLLAAALLGSTLLLAAEASIATTDAVLLACVLGVQGVMTRAYLASRNPELPAPSLKLALIGWAAFGLGVLVKGPAMLAAPGATIVALTLWDRQWRWLKLLRPLPGLALAAVIVLPWAIAILIQTKGAFYQQSLGNDFAAKLVSDQESHGAPPGYYLLLTTLTFWPAILFLAPALASAIRRYGEPAIRILLAWGGATWLLFELVPTKLPHYVLPAYPALAILAAVWAQTPRDENEPRWQARLTYVAAIQFALGVAAFAAAPLVLPRLYGMGSAWWLYAAVAAGLGVGIAALALFLRQARLSAFACSLAAAFIFYPTLTVGTAPLLQQLWVSQRLAAIVKAKSVEGDPPVALAGYEEPSLIFLLGTDTRISNAEGAANAAATQGGLALVTDEERSAFFAHLAELEADADRVAELSGFNYSRGRPVHINVYRVGAVRQVTSPPPE
jgi:4-amino-4-deoxy-L-arabinose transferase-like glycosyltransferase